MSEFKLSVIISAYNVEKYIAHAIEMLAHQTLDNIEVILIDDGSTDSTPEIIEQRVKNLHNFVYIKNKRNIGLGRSRNEGIRVSKGEYIGFCDADDSIERDYYEKLYNAATDAEADIACCSIRLDYDDGRRIIQPRTKNNCVIDWYGAKVGKKIKDRDYRVITNEVAAGHWSSTSSVLAIFRKGLVGKDPFGVGVCEDIEAVLPMIASAKKVVYVPDLYYGYYQRPGSLEQSGFTEKRVGIIDGVCHALRKIDKLNKPINIQCVLINHLLPTFINFFKLVPKGKREEVFTECYNRLKMYSDVEKYWYFLDDDFVMGTIKNYPKHLQEHYVHAITALLEGNIAELLDVLYECEGVLTNENPMVSIIIPVYNGANYMREAIDSALKQDYPNIEIIVVNDGSKDNGETDRIARSYGDRIRYIKKENGGVSTALNVGIQAMKGDYFSWLSHDDLYLPNKISVQMDYALSLRDRKTVVIGGYELFNSADGSSMGRRCPLDMYTREQVDRPLFGVFHGLINGCCMLIHRSHFDRIGLFDEKLRTTQDYDMWFRMLKGKKAYYHNEVIVKSRCHPEQESRTNYHQKDCFELWKSLIDRTTTMDRVAMSGSELEFYKMVYQFLHTQTPYRSAAAYAEIEYINQLNDEYEKGIIDREKLIGEIVGITSGIDRNGITQLLNFTIDKEKNIVVLISGENSAYASELIASLCNKYYIINFVISCETEFHLYDDQSSLTIHLPYEVYSKRNRDGLILFPNAKLILSLLDGDMLKCLNITDVPISNIINVKTGIYLGCKCHKNLYAFYCAGRVDFVLCDDEATKRLYSCIYENMIDDISDSCITNQVCRITSDEETEYLNGNSTEMRDALEKLFEDNQCIGYMAGELSAPVQVIRMAVDSEAEIMKKTVSWRITKPLRVLTAMKRKVLSLNYKDIAKSINRKFRSKISIWRQ